MTFISTHTSYISGTIQAKYTSSYNETSNSVITNDLE